MDEFGIDLKRAVHVAGELARQEALLSAGGWNRHEQARLNAQRDMYGTTWSWALEHAPHRADAGALCVRFVCGAPNLLLRYWPVDELAVMAPRALALAAALGQWTDAATAAITAAAAETRRGHPRAVVRWARAALRLSRRLKDTRREGQALAMLAEAMVSLGRRRRALLFDAAHARRALDTGDELGYAEALRNLGESLEQLGRVSEAMVLYGEAKRVAQSLDHARLRVSVLNNMAVVEKYRGDIDACRRHYAEQGVIGATLADERLIERSRRNLMLLETELRRTDDANDYLEAVGEAKHPASAELSARYAMGEGMVSLRLGDVDAAVRKIEASRARAREASHLEVEAEALANLANVYKQLGRIDDARRAHEDAIALARRVHHPRGEAIATHNLAAMLLEGGDTEGAEVLYLRALALHRAAEDRLHEPHTLRALAKVAVLRADLNGAASLFAQAVERFEQQQQEAAAAVSSADLAEVLGALGRNGEAAARAERALGVADVFDEEEEERLRARILAWR